jgi:hypothetical protein
MDADLDLLLTAVYVTADDLLPCKPGERQAKRHRRGGRHALRCPGDHGVPTSLSEAEGNIAGSGIPSDRRFLAVASKRLCHLFPTKPLISRLSR